jgi:hypothetical protein
VKIEALAQLGAMLKGMEKNKGTAGLGRPSLGGSIVEPPKNPTTTLKELGIDKKTSMIAQQLAALPEEVRQAIFTVKRR